VPMTLRYRRGPSLRTRSRRSERLFRSDGAAMMAAQKE